MDGRASDPAIDLTAPLDRHHVDGPVLILHGEDNPPAADARFSEAALIAQRTGEAGRVWRLTNLFQPSH